MEKMIKRVYDETIDSFFREPKDGDNLQTYFKPDEINTLKKITEDIWNNIRAKN